MIEWESFLYYSDEVFDVENYNEKSIRRESKIALKKVKFYN